MNINDFIIYRPYRSYMWFVPLTIIITIFSFVAFVFSFQEFGFPTFFTFIFCLLAISLTKTLYNSSKITVFFDDVGLLITDGNHKNNKQFNWDYFSNVYYIRNFKGHSFAVLTPNTLTSKERKIIANHSIRFSNLCIDRVVLIYLDALQKDLQLKEFIEHYVGSNNQGTQSYD